MLSGFWREFFFDFLGVNFKILVSYIDRFDVLFFQFHARMVHLVHPNLVCICYIYLFLL